MLKIMLKMLKLVLKIHPHGNIFKRENQHNPTCNSNNMDISQHIIYNVFVVVYENIQESFKGIVRTSVHIFKGCSAYSATTQEVHGAPMFERN
jgi:hypothetical protein